MTAPPSWVGPPRVEERAAFHAAVNASGQEYHLGDAVYLRAAQPGQLPFVARLESLHEQQDDGSAWAGVRWFYRPTELEVGHEVSFEQGEVFASDDFASHPLSAVCGRCEVLTHAQAERSPGGSAVGPAGLDTFVCSRKYIPSEHRNVPLEQGVMGDSLLSALQEKPFVVVDGRVVQRSPTSADKAPMAAAQPRPKRGRSAPDAAKAATDGGTMLTDGGSQPTGAHPPQQQPHSKRRRREADSHPSEPPPAAAVADAVASDAAAGECGAASSVEKQPPSTSAVTDDGSALSGGTSGGRHRNPAAPRYSKSAGKATTGRWSKERYEGAQQSLVASMRRLQATAADRAILRPALREEARKSIGDTGLLDHLLKHLAGQVVCATSGERLQRRHNKDGQMVYWLQTPADAEHEQEVLREEMETLSSELAEVKEARRVLHAVRGEAALAIQVVSGIRERPEELVKALSAATRGQPREQPAAAPSPGLHPSHTAPGGGCADAAAVHGAATLEGALEGLPPTPVQGAVPAGLSQADVAAGGQPHALLRQLQGASIPPQPAADAAGGGGGVAAAACLLSSQLTALAELAQQLTVRCETLEHQAAANQLRIASLEQQLASLTPVLPNTTSAMVGQPAAQAALLAASGGATPSSGPISCPAGSGAGPASAAAMLHARQATDPFSMQQQPESHGLPGAPTQQAAQAMTGVAQLWGGAAELPFGVGSNEDPFMQPQHTEGCAAAVPGMFGQLAMLPVPAAGSVPFSLPRHLQLQQQLAVAATMAVATQPCLSHAGLPAKASAGGGCQQPQSQQQQQQGPPRQPTLSGLMQDPRFARMLNPHQQIRSSVCSGPAGRGQSPPKCGTLDKTPLQTQLAPGQAEGQPAHPLPGSAHDAT